MKPILQNQLPHDVPQGKLPGIAPLDPANWLHDDEAFVGQMGERENLIRTRRDDVIALDRAALPAAQELLSAVLAHLRSKPSYRFDGQRVIRPDGVGVEPDPKDPLASLGHLVQEDFCLLEKRGDEHVMTGAVLCFPAGWTLSEKFLKPLGLIHAPVAPYDANMARRVQRMFDAIRPEQPLWRANALFYDDPALFAPHRESQPRPAPGPNPRYLRSERQSLVRLPNTDAVVFSIHTYLVMRQTVPGLAD